MTDRPSDKRAADVGSDSPASEEAKEQTRSGMQGAPRGEGEEGGTDRQPPQSSGRSGPGPEPRARKQYDAGERPSEQGDGSPSPGTISQDDALHGQKRQAGSGATGEDRGEDEATVHEK
jgi:hypothetical protein